MTLKDIALYAYNNGITITFEGVMLPGTCFPAIKVEAHKGDIHAVIVMDLHDLDDGNYTEFMIENLIHNIKRHELKGEETK